MTTAAQVRAALSRRWHPAEWLFWAAAAGSLLLSGHHLLLTEIAILALFALSLPGLAALAVAMTAGVVPILALDVAKAR